MISFSNQINFKSNMNLIGGFHSNGKIRVSDPCYTPNTWCSGVIDTIKGNWTAAVIRLTNEETGGCGDRVAVLAIKHEDCDIPLCTDSINEACDAMKSMDQSGGWSVSDIDVGVDSGQAGFFDEEEFVRVKSGDDTAWYNNISNVTLGVDAGVIDYGVVSTSGYGDGGYKCVIHTGENDLVDFAFIVFISPDEQLEPYEI